MNIKSRYVGDLQFVDPVTGESVVLEIHHDPSSNSHFAVDFDFTESGDGVIQSPYNEGEKIECAEPPQDVMLVTDDGAVFAVVKIHEANTHYSL